MLTSTIALQTTTATLKAGEGFRFALRRPLEASLPLCIHPSEHAVPRSFVNDKGPRLTEPKQRIVVVLHQPVDVSFKPPNNPFGKGGRKV